MNFIQETKLVIISENTSFIEQVQKKLNKCGWIKSKQFKSLELFLASDIISRTIVLHEVNKEISRYELNLQKRMPDLKLIRVNKKLISQKPIITSLTQQIIQNSLAYQQRLN